MFGVSETFSILQQLTHFHSVEAQIIHSSHHQERAKHPKPIPYDLALKILLSCINVPLQKRKVMDKSTTLYCMQKRIHAKQRNKREKENKLGIVVQF